MHILPETPILWHLKTRIDRCKSFFAAALWMFLVGCEKDLPQGQEAHGTTTAAKAPAQNTNAAAVDAFPVYTYNVIHVWPHDRNAFTQGLVFLDGTLLESTGLNGESSLREVDLASGNVLRRLDVPSEYFAEGLAVLEGKLFQLTWQSRKGFVYDLKSFHLDKEFAYEGEGWGLTTDGSSLILSDGTDQIRFLDPITFAVKRKLPVVARGRPVNRLNELEYVKGEIFANVWGSQYVVRIDPTTGKVVGLIDFTGLLPVQDRDETTDVLNGIAYDSAGDRLFVTGKRWPKLFEVTLRAKGSLN